MGGYSEDPRYVWGVGAVPYLRAVDDSRWNAAASDPYLRWVRTYRYSRIADEFGFDRVSAMSVARRGTVARQRGVRITGRIAGDTVTRHVTGWDVRQRLALPVARLRHRDEVTDMDARSNRLPADDPVAAAVDGLDEEQRLAVTTPSSLVAVIAGAGSGKTRVLTRRVRVRASPPALRPGGTPSC